MNKICLILSICLTFVTSLSFGDDRGNDRPKKDCAVCVSKAQNLRSVMGLSESLIDLVEKAMADNVAEHSSIWIIPPQADRNSFSLVHPTNKTDPKCNRLYAEAGPKEIPSKCFMFQIPPSKEKPLKDRVPIYFKSNLIGYKGVF